MVYVMSRPTMPASTLLDEISADTDTSAVLNMRHDPRNSSRTASHRLIVMAGM
jgi:hypothetical protein